jgi:glycosyltransferase involved in cell wall biosynthesis
VILCVANLIPYKGHADLIEAFARARASLPEAVLLLAGRDDGLGVALTAQAEARAVIDHVRILGARDDVPDLLGAADLFALASHEEGLPNAVIEAMAAGCACVVTAVGGSARKQSVMPGSLFAPATLQHLPRRWSSSAATRRCSATLGSAPRPRARAEAEFSLEACVGRYVALYAGLAAGPPAGRACFPIPA